MKLAIVGATGLVGEQILKVLDERNFHFDELLLVASPRSAGKKFSYKGKEYTVVTPEQAIEQKPDIAIFSAGGGTSLEYAPKFAEAGSTVIDNSSAWRMDPSKKLIVPEVNAKSLTKEDKIIANPNCSTIQMIVAIGPLHEKYTIKRIVVSTYQSVTGSGKAAVDQLFDERAGKEANMVYPHQIDLNVLPHIDVFQDNGYTKEEMKMINETKKILEDDTVKVTATTVRIPTVGGHSESVNIEFEKEFDEAELRQILADSEGIIVQDDPLNNVYPMPLTSHNRDETFVGRIRRDETQEKTVNMWIVADNLRKGAATNTVQIAEYLVASGLV
ncbi:aspartate-semialdehyde dehydrogenase [Flammeovirga kamogawensis]|uniref:Aspartate-semialdehyde dehydrogenase n=1 Tax=Flammeovirga kamogawensis TaxID=373891 RepID=A0ABX8GQ91_9BACT|nr:aspartate-semialdehyde dehydrogenase [Flammeovirga kamogawensis]MBB6462021.1 aspartate-semialdehyde dehydrogenase [Flammeovirga kamogawensis]QWG05758.1 aspartate-semialdehyde dehydrogenase [Flammeovirga kamogawensis]TRX67583.1 aspartate-semialdehyde dehydrogenase [Flammeovirga kamogawensis]